MKRALQVAEASVRHVVEHESKTQKKNVLPNAFVELRVRHRSVRLPRDDVIVVYWWRHASLFVVVYEAQGWSKKTINYSSVSKKYHNKDNSLLLLLDVIRRCDVAIGRARTCWFRVAHFSKQRFRNLTLMSCVRRQHKEMKIILILNWEGLPLWTYQDTEYWEVPGIKKLLRKWKEGDSRQEQDFTWTNYPIKRELLLSSTRNVCYR